MIVADKVDNLESFHRQLAGEDAATVSGRFTGGHDDTVWYYEQVSTVLCTRVPGPHTDRLVSGVEVLVATVGRA
jgi:hypothetical protein